MRRVQCTTNPADIKKMRTYMTVSEKSNRRMLRAEHIKYFERQDDD